MTHDLRLRLKWWCRVLVFVWGVYYYSCLLGQTLWSCSRAGQPSAGELPGKWRLLDFVDKLRRGLADFGGRWFGCRFSDGVGLIRSIKRGVSAKSIRGRFCSEEYKPLTFGAVASLDASDFGWTFIRNEFFHFLYISFTFITPRESTKALQRSH